jgi:hypothetical protein
MNLVFANHSEEDMIYPLTVKETREAQEADPNIHKLTKDPQYTRQLVENTQLLCKGTAMVLQTALCHRAINWYPHYLQHPGATRLEETLRKGMQNTISKYVKNCHKCQINKGHKHKYGKLPTKLVRQNPWEALCIDLIGPYTLKGQDKTEIDFMCLTMIDPATSWLKIIELLVVEAAAVLSGTWGHEGMLTHTTPQVPYFNKSSAMISTLVNKIWFSQYPHC